MSSLTKVDCPAGAWTKVFSDAQEGILCIGSHAPLEYRFCFVDHDGAAPEAASEGFLLTDEANSFNFSDATDGYVWATGEAGSVLVSVSA